MTKARWRHIFVILSLIIGIFWSTSARAQSFVDDVAGRAKNLIDNPNLENLVNMTPGKIAYDTARDVSQKALDKGKEVYQNMEGGIAKSATAEVLKAMENAGNLSDGFEKVATGALTGNSDKVNQGVQQMAVTVAQGDYDARQNFEKLYPILRNLPLPGDIKMQMELIHQANLANQPLKDFLKSDVAKGLAEVKGLDGLLRAVNNTLDSVATGSGLVTYDGNCEATEGNKDQIAKDGASAAQNAYDKLEDIQKKYDAVKASKVCDDTFNVEDVFNGILTFNGDALIGAKQAGGSAEESLRALNGEDGKSEFAKHSSINFNTLFNKAAAKVYEAERSTDPEVKKNLQKYKNCKTQMDELRTMRGNSQDDKDSYLYYYHQANQMLTSVAILNNVALRSDAECKCERDEDGKETGKIAYCEVKNNGELENNMPDSCKSVAAYMQDYSSKCIICAKFATILGAAQKVSQNAFEATAAGFIKLLGIGLLLYIGYLTLITIGSPETQKLSKYLTSLLIQGFKVAIAILILQNPTFLYEKVVTPILDGGLDFGLTLNGMGLAAAKDLGTSYADQFDVNSAYLGGDIVQSLTGTVHGFQNAAADVPGMGRALICNAFHDKVLGIFPHFTLLFNGILLLVFGLMIMLAIGFYIFDCAVELCLVCALMAFFVACWPFKLTSAYTRVGWNMLLNVFFNFVMMGIIVKTINELASLAVSSMGKEGLMEVLDTGNPTLIDTAFDMGGNSIMLVFICCILCLKMTKESGNLANKFASGAQIHIGAQLAGLAASAATAVGVAAINPLLASSAGAAGAAVGAHNQMEMLENEAAQQTDAAKNMAGMSAAGKGKSKGFGRLLSSIAENSGAKNAINKATNSVQNRLMGAIGKVGLGAGAEMGSKGRDKDANKKDRKAGF